MEFCVWTSKSNIKDKISSLENTWQIADLMTALNELLTVSIKPISIHLYDTCRLMCSLSVDKGVKKITFYIFSKKWLKKFTNLLLNHHQFFLKQIFKRKYWSQQEQNDWFRDVWRLLRGNLRQVCDACEQLVLARRLPLLLRLQLPPGQLLLFQGRQTALQKWLRKVRLIEYNVWLLL